MCARESEFIVVFFIIGTDNNLTIFSCLGTLCDLNTFPFIVEVRPDTKLCCTFNFIYLSIMKIEAYLFLLFCK